jgi:hypothetical protein
MAYRDVRFRGKDGQRIDRLRPLRGRGRFAAQVPARRRSLHAEVAAALARSLLDTATMPQLTLAPGSARTAPIATITTAIPLAATPAQVWPRLMLYEQLEHPLPLPLRLVLPTPVRTLGGNARVGDEAWCLYRGGHLVKRITALDARHRYAYDVTEQRLDLGGNTRLIGGAYELDEPFPGVTMLTATTSYLSERRPRWLWQPVEAAVCHALHREVLHAVGRNAGVS